MHIFDGVVCKFVGDAGEGDEFIGVYSDDEGEGIIEVYGGDLLILRDGQEGVEFELSVFHAHFQ